MDSDGLREESLATTKMEMRQLRNTCPYVRCLWAKCVLHLSEQSIEWIDYKVPSAVCLQFFLALPKRLNCRENVITYSISFHSSQFGHCNH